MKMTEEMKTKIMEAVELLNKATEAAEIDDNEDEEKRPCIKALMTEEEHTIFERMEKEGLMPCYVGGKDYVVKRISCLRAGTFLEISTSHFWYDTDEVKHYLVDIGGTYDRIPTPYYMTLDEYIAKCKELT